MMPNRRRIVLASTSPRRIELLRQIGLRCEVMAPRTDETPLKNEKPADLVTRLALEKARSVARLLRGRNTLAPVLIIAADTIVVEPRGKSILGKPRSRAEAVKMLTSIQGATHVVLTAYCILEMEPGSPAMHSLVRAVKSSVTLRPLSPAQIRAYVGTGEPMDKAGAYAAQGIGMALIERISGSYANVVGLPVSQLLADLEQQFDVHVLK